MNKTVIRKFAEWAREKLIDDIKYKAGTVGITEKGIAEKLPQSTSDTYFYDVGTKDYAKISGIEIKQRDALVKAIQTKERSYKSYQEAFENVIEEVAYTWFNRLIAIRFMEVNDYLPSGVRVLSSENKAKKEPDLVTMPFDTDLEFTSYEQDRIIQLKDDNKLDELFRMLFIKQCNKLHDILPDLFEKTDDYSELLLTIPFTDPDGIIYHLVNDIEDVDFRINDEMYTDAGKIKADGQVEIIGWLYQYYISKRHDEVIAVLGKKSITKKDIPAATQLFTTDWVVRYMVDNSLGRYWIERNPQSKLAEKLEFFVTPKNGEIQYVDEKVSPTDLTFFDPCMGSGHILVYAFDVLMEIYREVGYFDRDAALSIVENNLFGMDIDKRAYQLAYFAVMMKARSYNRRALTKGISNNLSVVEESNSIDKFACNGLTTDNEQNKIGEYLVEAYKDAQEIGTLQTVAAKDYDKFAEYLYNISITPDSDFSITIWKNSTLSTMCQLVRQAQIMSKKYAVVCTNPPYMNKLEGQLKKFVIDNYKPYSGDLFSVFMYRNFGYCKADGYSAFMTPFVWMFIKTYEKLREFVIDTKSITTLVQMEYSAFEEATVPICSFVLKNSKATEKALCFRLSDFKGGMEVQKQKVLEAIDNKNCGYFYEAEQSNFLKIPGATIAYWLSKNMLGAYEAGKNIGEIAFPKTGMTTGDNNRFLRMWFEVNINNAKFDVESAKEAQCSEKKWFPYCKGGGFRRWYGYNEYLVNWFNDGYEIKNNIKANGLKAASVRSENMYFKPLITWSAVTSGLFSCRYCFGGALFDSGGSSISVPQNAYYLLSVLNGKIGQYVLDISNATINYQPGDIAGIPIIFEKVDQVESNAQLNIQISKTDWDSFETSWDFKKHPLASYSTNKTSTAFELWAKECAERFNQLKENEEELNRIFIDIYGLQGELTPEVEDKDVTVRKADLQRDIKSLISYAVGCMFGRYSLEREGIVYAGGNFDDVYWKYKGQAALDKNGEPIEGGYAGISLANYHYPKFHDTEDWETATELSFEPDADNCIPITDEEYFEDDIVGLFCAWLKKVYGEDTLEENLDFIANALGNKGKTSREVIRNYFLTDFIKDHIKNYQKRPIYWLFDSGKQNGFKALIYMHRWNADTIGNVRVEYLHRIQRVYEKEITRMQEIIDNSYDNKEISNATKRKEKLQKQIKETKDYDAKIAHLALSRIDIDLDDGVKVNYEKVQTADGKKMQILAKI